MVPKGMKCKFSPKSFFKFRVWLASGFPSLFRWSLFIFQHPPSSLIISLSNKLSSFHYWTLPPLHPMCPLEWRIPSSVIFFGVWSWKSFLVQSLENYWIKPSTQHAFTRVFRACVTWHAKWAISFSLPPSLSAPYPRRGRERWDTKWEFRGWEETGTDGRWTRSELATVTTIIIKSFHEGSHANLSPLHFVHLFKSRTEYTTHILVPISTMFRN